MNYEDMAVLDAQACRKWFNANQLPSNMERIFAECWSAALASRPAMEMPVDTCKECINEYTRPCNWCLRKQGRTDHFAVANKGEK